MIYIMRTCLIIVRGVHVMLFKMDSRLRGNDDQIWIYYEEDFETDSHKVVRSSVMVSLRESLS
jgi:hypothetical protein